MKLSEVTKEWLSEEYEGKLRSFQDIAKELGTYPNAVRRLAIKLGIAPRDKSAAQSAALKGGRHAHPTKGKARPESVKIAISEGVSKSWQNLSQADYQKRVEQGKQSWANMTDDERERLRSLATEAIRKTSSEGSQLEKFIVNHLKSHNYLIEFHKDNLLQNDKLEIDLFLPDKSIAIEIDGPSHFLPIWGEEALQKTIKADNEKNNLLLGYKISVIRVKQLKKNLSAKNLRDIAAAVLNAVKQLEMDVNRSKGKLVTIEV